MKRKPYSRRKRTTTKSVLRLPDLEHAKAAVLNSLTSPDAQRGYRQASDEFIDWYCSEPRLALNRIVVLRYRPHLESRQLAPGTVTYFSAPSPHPRLYGRLTHDGESATGYIFPRLIRNANLPLITSIARTTGIGRPDSGRVTGNPEVIPGPKSA